MDEPQRKKITFLGGSSAQIRMAKFPQAVYVLNAFKKTTKKTPRANIEAAKAAYAQIPKPKGKGTK